MGGFSEKKRCENLKIFFQYFSILQFFLQKTKKCEFSHFWVNFHTFSEKKNLKKNIFQYFSILSKKQKKCEFSHLWVNFHTKVLSWFTRVPNSESYAPPRCNLVYYKS